MKNSMIAGVVLATVMGISGANAQTIQFGSDGVRILPPGYHQDYRHRDGVRHERLRDRGISERQAIRIARQNGVREIDRVQSRANSIRVTGYDRRDNRIVVVVDRRDGDVIDVRRRSH